MTKPKYPIFLSGKPSGKDKMAGGSHKKTAKIITQTIKSEILEKRVIGLEGEWGSGKSNIIKIIEEQLGTDYYMFIFDSWGNQEDLTRKSFLEQLISQLFDASFLTDTDRWSKLENQLLSKTSTTRKQKFPKTKSYWVLLTISVLLLTGLSSVYDNVLVLNNDLLPQFNFGSFWKPVLAIYLLPIIFLIWAICLGAKDYCRLRAENEEKENRKRESKWDTLGKIFYWFSGQEIDTEEVENILEEEPSVKKFRDYFSKIERGITHNHKKLVIVFDNIDRLEKDKVKSLWSSIHTFFADDNDSVDSWIIVPYDKAKLNEHFGGNGFIQKTFAINFRVTPPVVTQWEAFLQESISDAFGKDIITKKEKEYIIKLFDILVSAETIKPRQIINYVNDLTALYLQWETEITKGEIKLRYLALFILVKIEILKNPNDEILSRKYLKGAVNQFEDVAELDESISALTFGVNKKLANEVLLLRELQMILRAGDVDKMQNYLGHTAFDSYFHKAYFSIEIVDKINGLAKILEVVSEKFSNERKHLYWSDFAKKIVSVDIVDEFKEFNDNHKAILKNTNKENCRAILVRLIKELEEGINPLEGQDKYYSQLLEIEKFINDEKIDIKFTSLINQVNLNVDSYLKFIAIAKYDYKKYLIKCTKEELYSRFFTPKDNLVVNDVYEELDNLKIIKEDYDLSDINDIITTKFKSLGEADKDQLDKSLQILKSLSVKPLQLELSDDFFSQISSEKLESDDIFIEGLCIAISNFQVSHSNSYTFNNLLLGLTDEQITKISNKIEWYFSFQDLLVLLVSNKVASEIPQLKKIALELTLDIERDFVLDVNWSLKEFDKIALKVFDNKRESVKFFIEKLSVMHKLFDIDVNQIAKGFFKYLNYSEIILIDLIAQESLKYFDGLLKEDILKSLQTHNIDFKIFKALFENNLIQSFSDAFYSSYDDYIKDIASENEGITEIDFLNKLLDNLNTNKLKSTFTSVRDIFINQRGELEEGELEFFVKGLIYYGNLTTRAEESTLKIIIPLIKSDKNFNSFLDNKNLLLPVIHLSKEHRDTAIGELQLRYDSEKHKKDERMIEVASALNLKKADDIENNISDE
ncbi:P-loop NTPase fold protein [Zobellia roscoffensis]|uniref:P-loop NTPase fold protein n=1 Tax=Zobellia roscoffensis TaxID=2779508 RepID=UPI00188A9328|nr:P-loop NTPase fold protein [Zobellia roscoffensis]